MAIFQQHNNNEWIFIWVKTGLSGNQHTTDWPENIAGNHHFSAFAFKDILFQQRL